MSFLYNDEKARFATLPRNERVIFNNASPLGVPFDEANYVQVCSSGDYGSLITVLMATSTDTAGVVIHLAIKNTNTGDFSHIYTITVPLASGTNGTTVAYNILNNTIAQAFDTGANGKYYIKLAIDEELWAAPNAAITATKSVQIFASLLDFKAPV